MLWYFTQSFKTIPKSGPAHIIQELI